MQVDRRAILTSSLLELGEGDWLAGVLTLDEPPLVEAGSRFCELDDMVVHEKRGRAGITGESWKEL
jgi:hypothetical protein